MTQFHDDDWWSKRLKQMLENQEPEDSHLEYKDKRRLLPTNKRRPDELSKDVSSFLNSDGGVLIYGVPETNDPNVTGGAPVPLNVSGSTGIGFNVGEIDKETIENLITSNIQPKPGPDQFQITEVKHGQRIVFVVQVAVGIGEVWQAKDKRYYRRFHYKAEPMEHYEIGLVRARNIGPSLKLVFGLNEGWQKNLRRIGSDYHPTGRHPIHLGVQNTSNSVAESALIELGVDGEMTLPAPFEYAGTQRVKCNHPDLYDVLMRWFRVSWTASNPHLAGKYAPIFKTVSPIHVANFEHKFERQMRPWVWRIQASNMIPLTGVVSARQNPSVFHIDEEDHKVEIA